MALTRSKCRNLISLTSFERNNPKREFLKLYAWDSKTLEHFHVSQSLSYELNMYYQKNRETFGELVEVAFCGNQKYLQLIFYQQLPERTLKEYQEYEMFVLDRKQQRKGLN